MRRLWTWRKLNAGLPAASNRGGRDNRGMTSSASSQSSASVSATTDDFARLALNPAMLANLATLGVTLYACGFVNFAGIIAEWNVDHRPPPDQTSIFLDTYYLTQLGPEAIPAIDHLLAAGDTAWPIWISEKREEMAAAHLQHMQDWRSWTFRGWRLMRYLDQHPAMIGSEGQGEISGE